MSKSEPTSQHTVIQEVLNKHVQHSLTESGQSSMAFNKLGRSILTPMTDSDRQTLQQASNTLLKHASAGLWIGASVGTLFAFRSRARMTARSIKVNGVASEHTLQSLFYPKPSQGVKAGASAGQSEGRKAGMAVRSILKGVGYGLLGAGIGAQTGVITGTLKGRTIIQAGGKESEERIAAAIRQVTVELNERVGTDVTNGQGSFNNGFVDQVKNEVIIPDETFYAGQTMSDADTPSTSTVTTSEHSSWDALRKANLAPPSAWDSIRTSSTAPSNSNKLRAEGSLPDGSSGQGFKRDGDNMSTTTEEGMSKEEQRAEFDRLMERERGGVDAAGAAPRWRRE